MTSATTGIQTFPSLRREQAPVGAGLGQAMSLRIQDADGPEVDRPLPGVVCTQAAPEDPRERAHAVRELVRPGHVGAWRPALS